jgi:hypothetical protein
MEGLGDLVAKVTEVTGIKAVVEAVAPNGGCGCAQRQQKLNAMFPFGTPKDRYYTDKINNQSIESNS